MARPKSADPLVAITLRVPASAMAVWDDIADDSPFTTRKLLEMQVSNPPKLKGSAVTKKAKPRK